MPARDEHGHELINYDDVVFDEDVYAAGPESLIAAMRRVSFRSTFVYWCPICRVWSVRDGSSACPICRVWSVRDGSSAGGSG